MRLYSSSPLANGVEFLDSMFDREDWTESIDLDTLDMADGYNCVLGHLFPEYEGDFSVACESLEIEVPEDLALEISGSVCAEYEILTSHWREVVTESRNGTLEITR